MVNYHIPNIANNDLVHFNFLMTFIVSFCISIHIYVPSIAEQKTGKARRHQVPEPVYNYIRDYCRENSINPERRIFQFSERAVQKALKAATEFLDIPKTSTHSFRKFAGQQVYKNSGNDIEVERGFYQHSSLTVTQAYIAYSSERLTQAINSSVSLPLDTHREDT